MMWRARYTTTLHGDAVLIEDMNNGSRSVTNDAERVISDLVERGIDVDAMVIVYRDSEGVWDQMLTHAGKFLRFYPLRLRDGQQAALNALRRR